MFFEKIKKFFKKSKKKELKHTPIDFTEINEKLDEILKYIKWTIKMDKRKDIINKIKEDS